MLITSDTKVAELLKEFPQLEPFLLQFSPAFATLKNPVLRCTVAKVTSLQQAAKVGGVNIVEMVDVLRAEAGQPPLGESFCPDNRDVPIPFSEWDAAAKRVTRTFDARVVIEAGEHPKDAVLAEAAKLQSGDCLEIITPFPPAPLVELLQKRGFTINMAPPENSVVRTFVKK